MKRWLVLLVFLQGVAWSTGVTALPLKGYTFCLLDEPLTIDDGDFYLLPNAKKELTDWLKINLSAYRLHNLEKCKTSTKTGYVNVSIGLTKPINTYNRGYIVNIKVQALDWSTGGVITLWNELSYGVTSKNNQEVFDSFKAAMSESMTRLAADYNTVNP